MQSITLDHKKYEDAITGVGASFKRSLAVREKRRLELIDLPPAAAAAATNAGKAEAGARRPKYFREVGGGDGRGEGAAAAARGRGQQQQQQRQAGGREHLPPASSSLDTYTLLKFYSLSAPILQSVFRGLQDAEVCGTHTYILAPHFKHLPVGGSWSVDAMLALLSCKITTFT